MFRSKKVNLHYALNKADKALTFQVLEQSNDVYAFLEAHPFQAKNGMRIAIDRIGDITNNGQPEIKDSANVIFLRGRDTSRNNDIDITRFAANAPYRDTKHDMFVEALEEFNKAVKLWVKKNTVNVNYFEFVEVVVPRYTRRPVTKRFNTGYRNPCAGCPLANTCSDRTYVLD